MGEGSWRTKAVRWLGGTPEISGLPFEVRRKMEREALVEVVRTGRFWVTLALAVVVGMVGPVVAMWLLVQKAPGSPVWSKAANLFEMVWLLLVLAVFQFPWNAMHRPKMREVMRRWSQRICLGCGYDIRESPERCPECGGEVAHG